MAGLQTAANRSSMLWTMNDGSHRELKDKVAALSSILKIILSLRLHPLTFTPETLGNTAVSVSVLKIRVCFLLMDG